jgi:hypothetical protein
MTKHATVSQRNSRSPDPKEEEMRTHTLEVNHHRAGVPENIAERNIVAGNGGGGVACAEDKVLCALRHRLGSVPILIHERLRDCRVHNVLDLVQRLLREVHDVIHGWRAEEAPEQKVEGFADDPRRDVA